MKTTRSLLILSALASLSILAHGCGEAEDEGVLGEEAPLAAADTDADTKADALQISFTTFSDDVGSRGTTETRRTFTTAASYRAYFGHDAPGVDFRTQMVTFFAGGMQRTGGYRASVANLSRSASGLTLKITTRLSSPGPDCIVTQATTKPYTLIKYRKPTPRPEYVRYYGDDVTRSCAPAPAVPHCGGITARPCPGSGSCVDDPTDSCDPSRGGADCGGVCECNIMALCIQGYHFDRNPTVCKCVPTATSGGVACGRNTCAAGQVCCNPLQGICTPPDGFCIF